MRTINRPLMGGKPKIVIWHEQILYDGNKRIGRWRIKKINGRVVMESLEAFWGYTPKQLVGRRPRSVVSPRKKFQLKLNCINRTRQAKEI